MLLLDIDNVKFLGARFRISWPVSGQFSEPHLPLASLLNLLNG